MKATQVEVKKYIEGLPDSRMPDAEMMLIRLNEQRKIIEDLDSPASLMIVEHIIKQVKRYADAVLEPSQRDVSQILKCPECKKGQISVNHAFYHSYKSVLTAVTKLVADYKMDNERIKKGERK